MGTCWSSKPKPASSTCFWSAPGELTPCKTTPAHLLGFDQFELHAAAGPRDEVGVARVVQQGDQELPELQRTSALVRRTLAKDASALLLDLTWKRGKRTEVDSGTSVFR